MAVLVSLKPPPTRSLHFIPIVILALYIASRTETYILLTCIAAILLLVLKSYQLVEEEVLLVPALGLQYTTKYVWGNEKTTFVHWGDIKNIVINEVLYSHTVIYILTILVDDQVYGNYQMPLFKIIKPQLQRLEEIYQELYFELQNG